jgi:hypothetical protein
LHRKGGDVASHPGTRVSTTDPYYYPYAILTRRRNASEGEGYELHFLEGVGPKADWAAHAERLQRSGEFSEVRFCTVGLMDDHDGTFLGG